MQSVSKSVVAVILGGGAGSRLSPLTSSRSKPAVPIAGKYRLVDIPISNCMNSNINRIFVLTQYNSASLNQHIKNTYHFSAFSTGFVDVLAAEQTPDNPGWFQGTADAVKQSLRHISTLDFEYILILSGDQLYQMDFTKMLDSHKENKADLSIATIPVGERDATEFGIMKTNEKSLITSFIEKPNKDVLPQWASDTGVEMLQQGRPYLASMGIYIFNKNVLYDLLNDKYPKATDFGKEIIPNSISNYVVSSYQYNGYWTDIGNIHSFFEANLDLTEDLPKFNLFDKSNAIYTRARMLPPAKIMNSTFVKSIIAEGSIIACERLEKCLVGIRSRIGEGTKINNTYIMGNDYYESLDQMNANVENNIPLLGIGEKCEISFAIIDKNCRIGNGVKINGGTHLSNTEQDLYTIKDGIVVVKKGALIPNGFVIG
jgi:glucose-1-phosphate adenylyltransferase